MRVVARSIVVLSANTTLRAFQRVTRRTVFPCTCRLTRIDTCGNSLVLSTISRYNETIEKFVSSFHPRRLARELHFSFCIWYTECPFRWMPACTLRHSDTLANMGRMDTMDDLAMNTKVDTVQHIPPVLHVCHTWPTLVYVLRRVVIPEDNSRSEAREKGLALISW